MNEKTKKAATLPKHRTASLHGWWWDLLGKIVAWLAGIILVLTILAMIAAVVYLLAQWLLSYDKADPSTPTNATVRSPALAYCTSQA